MTDQIILDPLLDLFMTKYEKGNLNDLDFQLQALANIKWYVKWLRKTTDALMVIANTPHIQAYLIENDPKAFEQVKNSINMSP